jgi:DNA-binding FadR family transcriptional regulator
MTASNKLSGKDPEALAPGPTLSTRAHSMLFGPLGSTDVPTAVVHRLRAAIGLGLLKDGQRLPKEADLAAQMGITTFALREALAELRNQGLLTTRAGKNGGSFVTPGAGHEEVEKAELGSLSSSELRDLADWRRMLAAHAAALAALRGSESNLSVLRDCVTRVARADSSLEARRALGRFYLELASAAQSKRLARAEFAVHEQIDWLFGLALTNPAERRASATALGAVVDAVSTHDADAARTAAAAQIDRLVGRLAQRRLEVIAEESAQRPDERPNLEAELRSLIAGLTGVLEAIADDVAPVLADGAEVQRIRTTLLMAVLQRFATLPSFIEGLGLLAEVGVVPDHPYWIQWWRRTDDGPVEDNHHEMDPSSEDFYDYRFRDYMTQPRNTHRPYAYGPYVDYGGVDDYIVTLTAPVLDGAHFLGAATTDISVSDLESYLAPWLAGADECVLLNADGRVIVSNAVQLSAGDVMTSRAGYRAVRYAEFGWTLLTRPARKRRTRHSA